MINMLKKIRTLLVSLLIGGMVMGNAAYAATVPEKYSASTDPSIVYHWCNYMKEYEGSNIATGFQIVVVDQGNNQYVVPKEYIQMDYSGHEFLIVTKYADNNVVQWYEMTDKGWKQEMLWSALSPRGINDQPFLYKKDSEGK
jgi:hypothetical protein